MILASYNKGSCGRARRAAIKWSFRGDLAGRLAATLNKLLKGRFTATFTPDDTPDTMASRLKKLVG